MDDDFLSMVMLITANVGSIFEDPEHLLKKWFEQFLSKVKQQTPMFLGIHFQEIGGKNFEQSMKNVKNFVRLILTNNELKDFDKVCAFLDEDFTSIENFTALGNIYFIHNLVDDIKIFNFNEKKFVDIKEKLLYTGNIGNVEYIEKSKFPQENFPECKWSRKGFIRTRWNFNGNKFDLVNIHLFHDESNLVAIKESPSPYSMKRHDALKYTLKRFLDDEFENFPSFIFGDFNFRLDTASVVKKLTSHCRQENSLDKSKKEKILFKEDENKVYLTLGQKVFDLENTEKTFFNYENISWLNDFDTELSLFKDFLFELPKLFPPSYPFSEDNISSNYMKTRCPSWCDRILFTKQAKNLINFDEKNLNFNISYEMIGQHVPMGDHKPIMLTFYLPDKNKIDNDKIKKLFEIKKRNLSINKKNQSGYLDKQNQQLEKSATEENDKQSKDTKSNKDLNYLYISNQTTNDLLNKTDENTEKIENLKKDDQNHTDLISKKESNLKINNTRYVCVKSSNSQITVFRETAV